MKLDLAHTNEAEEISDFLNLAYRGKEGWTTENSLIEGNRSTIEDIRNPIDESTFFNL